MFIKAVTNMPSPAMQQRDALYLSKMEKKIMSEFFHSLLLSSVHDFSRPSSLTNTHIYIASPCSSYYMQVYTSFSSLKLHSPFVHAPLPLLLFHHSNDPCFCPLLPLALGHMGSTVEGVSFASHGLSLSCLFPP